MYSRQEFELLQRDLLSLDSQFVAKLPLSSSAHALNGSIELGSSLAWDAQGVGAAGIRPQVRERNLFRSALLKKKSLFGVKEEYGKGTVEEALVDVRHQMAWLGASN